MRKMLVALLLVAVPVTALHAMTVATFLTKAEALQRRGAMALLSSDLGLLKNEVTSVSAQLKSERERAVADGRTPAYCPPAQRASLNSEELLGHLRAIPPAQRERMEMRDAMRSFLVRKYPCAG